MYVGSRNREVAALIAALLFSPPTHPAAQLSRIPATTENGTRNLEAAA